jgi:serine/threonine protein kinase
MGSRQEAARLLLPITRPPQFTHEQGTVRRDVKPDNILLRLSGEPVPADYGIAEILADEEIAHLTSTDFCRNTSPNRLKN